MNKKQIRVSDKAECDELVEHLVHRSTKYCWKPSKRFTWLYRGSCSAITLWLFC